MPMRRHHLTALALASTLALGGCGNSSAEPDPLPPTQASTTPSPTPPAMPAAAADKTKAGAIAFVKHYVEALNYATFTGDTSVSEQLGSKQCSSCASILKSIAKVHEQGGAVEGGAWKPQVLSALREPGEDGWTIDTRISYGPQRVIRQAGADPEEFTGGSRLVTFVVDRADPEWVIVEWTRAS